MKRVILCIGLCLLMGVCSAEQSPRTSSRDSRIKIINFDANNVVKVIGHDLIQTSIEFHPNESILDVSSGDSLAWQWSVASGRSNVLFIKPMLDNSDTNMKVITNKRIYEFRLLTSSHDIDPNEITYRLSFKYPDEEQRMAQERLAENIRRIKYMTPSLDSKQWNYCYSFTGNKRLKPVQSFDDEKAFTYFQFPEGSSIPAIYSVEANQKEQLVNYRIEGPYVVVEKVTGQYTLRDGDLVATVINEKFIERAKA